MKHLIEVIGVKTLPEAIYFYNLNLGLFLIKNIICFIISSKNFYNNYSHIGEDKYCDREICNYFPLIF